MKTIKLRWKNLGNRFVAKIPLCGVMREAVYFPSLGKVTLCTFEDHVPQSFSLEDFNRFLLRMRDLNLFGDSV